MEHYVRLIGVPLVGGTALYALWILLGWIGRRSAGLRQGLAALAKAAALLVGAWTLWQAVDLFRHHPDPSPTWGVDVFGGLRLAVAFRMDALSALVVVGAAGIALAVILYSFRAMAGHDREPVYYAWILWTLGGALAAATAATFLTLILAWEITTVLLYLLISLGRPDGRAGAMKTLAILGFSDVCLLLGVVILAGAGLLPNDLAMGGEPIATGTGLTSTAFLLMAAAALAKAGAMPLHTWVPAASEGAPTPVFALLPAAVDKLLGIYLLARLTFGVFATGGTLATVLMVIGAATILCAVMMAMIQHDLKRLLAFHAVSQVGYMVLGMGVAAGVLAAGRASEGGLTPSQAAVAAIAFAGGLLHMLNNSIYKCCLFLGAGAAERVAGTTDLDRLGGLARVLPVTFICCLVAAAAISGVPPLNGFVSKWLVYQGALGLHTPLGTVCLVAAVFGSALTLASFVKVMHSVFLGTRGSAVPEGAGSQESGWMALPMIALAAACIVLGLGGSWAVGRLIVPAAQALQIDTAALGTGATNLVLWSEAGTQEAGGVRGLWDPMQATGLMLIGIVLGLVFYLVSRGMKVRIVPNFVGAEDSASDETWHVSGTHFYETIRRMRGLSTLFTDASGGAFDVYHACGQYGRTLVRRLQAWHTGLLAMYVSWVVLGLVVLVVVLAVV